MSAAVQRYRVLIVEDEVFIAADLRTTLEKIGYEVIGIAATGAEAVQEAERRSPDVVLMDIGLHGPMDGIAAAEKIGSQWNIPVIFITGKTSEEILIRASATGPFGFVLKPWRTEELNAAIVFGLQRHQLARELFSERTWLQTVLQSLSDGVIAADAAGHVRYMNAAAEALCGRRLHDMRGRPVEDLFQLTNMSGGGMEQCSLRVALQTKSLVGKSRFLLHDQDGHAIPIEEAASPIQSGGEVIGAVSVFANITEQIRREQESELEKQRLEEQVQQSAQALGETRIELRALAGHLMQAQEEERSLVARELHDDLGQRAAIAEIELEILLQNRPTDMHEALQTLRQRLRELSQGLREASHRLHPAIVSHLGLSAALNSLVEEHRRYGALATFLAHAVDSEPPEDVGISLYRIAQEALHNAAKHAPGASVRVVLEKIHAELHLRIEDQGPGFDLNLVRGKGGLGLISMQERARLMGGSLLLRTGPGNGTVIVARVPVPAFPRSA